MTGEDTPAAVIDFGTDGWRADLDVFTPERVKIVAQGIATHLADAEAGDTVVVGYDAREHSRGFAEDVAGVLCANGFDVLLPERDVPTPVAAWTVLDRDLAGAVVVTASHNPPSYNGLKFVPADGAPAMPAATEAIESALEEPRSLPDEEWGSVTDVDLVDAYSDHAREAVAAARDEVPDLDGLSIVYDAMHGSGRGVTDELLASAGADVTRLRCEADPEFGGTAPEPVPERAHTLVDAVRTSHDLGIINDGDADRIAVVTPERGFLDPNLFFAALYDDLLATGSGPVVRSVSTSSIVDRVAAAHDEAVYETPVGFKWVAAEMRERSALMGGEESGGFGITSHLRNKDGVLVALLAAAAAADRSFDDRVEDLVATHGAVVQDKVSLDCPDDRKAAVLQQLQRDVPDTLAGTSVRDVGSVDGVKLTLTDGSWVLIRPSGTEPKLRIYAEADGRERVDALLAAGRDHLESLR